MARPADICGAEFREAHPTAICSIPGCGKPHWARGWCAPHYQAWRRTGEPATYHQPRWSEAELQRLALILDSPKGGPERGELAELALILCRTESAVRSRLHRLRRERDRPA